MDKKSNARNSRITNPTPYAGLGKLPPQDTDAEEVILGAMLLQAEIMPLIATLIKPEAFYRDNHKTVCQAIVNLYRNSKKIDLITVKNELVRLGKLEEVGGAYALTELTNRLANAANIMDHIMIVNYMYQLREIIRCGTIMVNDGYDVTNNPFDIISQGVQLMDGIKNMNVRRTEKNMTELIPLMHIEINRPKTNGLLGLSSGSVALDSITLGWQAGQLIIPAARPAMGKTADMCSQIAHIGYTLKKPVGVFSLEMSAVQLTFRILSNISSVPQKRIKLNELDETEQLRVVEYGNKLTEAPIYMDDTAAIDIEELEAKATLWKAIYGIEILFVDYLQLVTIKNGKSFNNREGDVSAISAKLKKIAKNLQIPVVALCQLSRAVESRAGSNNMPILSDLRESGSIEQDADIVYFLWRPSYYNLEGDVSFPKFGLNLSPKNLLVKKVAKAREEETGLVPLQTDLSLMRVADHREYLSKLSKPELFTTEEADPPF